MEVSNSSIPVDVLYNIFLRLPAKSLLHFRCVSKFWCNVIDHDLTFANKHVSTRVAIASDEPQTLPISLPEITPTAWHSFACDGNLIKRIEYPTYIDKDYVVCQVGYGLLCFRHKYGGGDTLLCNPLRREVLKLPTARTGIYSGEWYGIGFDSINDTFKIVRVLSFSKSLVTEVHTLGTESWRHISSVPSCNSLSAIGVSACGDMHWTNGLPECKIISFNFQKEEFKLTPHPDFGMLQYRKDFMLVNLKGFLAVANFPQPTDIEIWVLKDYDKNVWMKEYRLTTKIYVNRVSSVSACCDGIFFHCDQIKELLFLHLRRNLILKTTCWGKRLAKAIFSYTASVVSLKNFGNLVADDDSKWCMIADLVEDDPMCSITWTNRAQTNVKGQRRLRFGPKIFRPPNGHWL